MYVTSWMCPNGKSMQRQMQFKHSKLLWRNYQLSGLKSQIKHSQDPPEESQQIPRILTREKVMESKLKWDSFM